MCLIEINISYKRLVDIYRSISYTGFFVETGIVFVLFT